MLSNAYTLIMLLSYDTRGAHAGTPSHWRDEEVLEDRAVFRTHKEPAELIINPVKVSPSPKTTKAKGSTIQHSLIEFFILPHNTIGKGCGQFSLSRGL